MIYPDFQPGTGGFEQEVTEGTEEIPFPRISPSVCFVTAAEFLDKAAHEPP